MASRNAFYSFHYDADAWRASQVRNMGVVDSNHPIADNDWESVKRGGDAAIERWIDGQLSGRSCVVVLIGKQTSERKWILKEIEKGWAARKGIVGIYVHNLKGQDGKTTLKGKNPFDSVVPPSVSGQFSSVVKAYDPPCFDSQQAYLHIKQTIGAWIEEAIAIRAKY